MHAPLLITGPTASGKSAYAMARAGETASVIINADSMQVYRDLAILTARPSGLDEAAIPHALYGFVDGAVAYSAGRYVSDVANALADAQAQQRRPIIVGGTGLYFLALLEGLSPVPPIPNDVRDFWRSEAVRLTSEELHAVLQTRDPDMAARLRPSDPQRVTRALEVLEATGRSLAEWHKTPGRPLIDLAGCEKVVVTCDRAAAYARADARFDQMVSCGALEEISALDRRRLDPALPVMRALGVPWLLQHGRGEMALSDAVAASKLETRRYIKRQLVWIKRNMISWKVFCAQ